MSDLRLLDTPQEMPKKRRRCGNCQWAAFWACYPGGVECARQGHEVVPVTTGGECELWAYGVPANDTGGGFEPAPEGGA